MYAHTCTHSLTHTHTQRSMKMNQGGATVKANMLHKELSGNKVFI
jgi:hypothetical protein